MRLGVLRYVSLIKCLAHSTSNAIVMHKTWLVNGVFSFTDGALFLQNGCLDPPQPHYIFLETIVEETSDDLRSESSGRSRGSPVGWLATDSESGSVIRVCDSDSDEESACPAKRRREEAPPVNHLPLDSPPLSRSSSLLQFESLEKHCQVRTRSMTSKFDISNPCEISRIATRTPAGFSCFFCRFVLSTRDVMNKLHNDPNDLMVLKSYLYPVSPVYISDGLGSCT